tara:strand:- start:46658 stop:46915 length:258 start_codon:yes stop_codon:yes gene_type:complete
MRIETRREILNLSQSIFDDERHNKIIKLLGENQYNELRVFVADEFELLEALFTLDKENEILKAQIDFCDKLEDVILDFFVEEVVH